MSANPLPGVPFQPRRGHTDDLTNGAGHTRPTTDPDTRPEADTDTGTGPGVPVWGTPDTRTDSGRGSGPDGGPDTGSGTGTVRPAGPEIGPDTGSAGGPGNGTGGVSGDGGPGHFDVSLDDDPEPSGTPVDPVELGAPGVGGAEDGRGGGGRRPVIPAELAGWAAARATVTHSVAVAGYQVAFWAVRTPWYVVQFVFWATVGVFRLVGRQLGWWWLVEQTGLRTRAADDNDPVMWFRLHREVKATRAWRFTVLAGEVTAAVIVWVAVIPVLPGWALAVALAAAVVGLARIGRPAGQPIVTRAVVTGRYRRVNTDIVLRAYYAAGLGHPDRAGKQVTFGSTMARDATNSGSQVVIDLPYGLGFDDVLKAKGGIASGLDVSVNQVFVARDTSSHRRHLLLVLDRDPLGIPAGRSPLLDGKPRDIWTPAPFGLDERGRKVTLALMWASVLVGAQPRKGKTFSARALALYAALDPFVRILLADGKNSPDWDKFRLVAHRAVFGTVPNSRDTDPVTHFVEMLREVKRHIQDVNELLSKLSAVECPEGKITRELSRKYPQLAVWLLILEEFQLYYELDDQWACKEVAELLSYIQAVGPSAGVIVLSSSQKPSGVGAGDVARLFNRFRDNHAVRFALKCGNRIVSEAVLGGDAYSEGFDASSLPTGDAYRGVGILYGASDHTPIVRTYLADHADTERILTAARKHRHGAGTLSGLAAGERTTRDTRDVLADTATVFAAGEKGLHWASIAERLAATYPEHYADLSADAISAQLRDLGLRSVDVKVTGTVLKGLRRDALDAAIGRRQP